MSEEKMRTEFEMFADAELSEGEQYLVGEKTWQAAWEASTASKQREIDSLNRQIAEKDEVITAQRLGWKECAERNTGLHQQVLELSAQVEAMLEALLKNAPQQIEKDWACAECHPESDMLVDGFKCKYHSALSTDPPSALLAHDNEVAAKALEDAAKWFDDNYIKVANADGIVVVCKANKILRRLATERRNRK